MKKIQIIGNVTKDAEVKHFENSRSVINFDVAVNERWKDRNGEKQEKTTFIRCAMWRDNTEIAKYITKGSKIYVEGSPEAEAYLNREQKAVATVKINVQTVEFLGRPQGQNGAAPGAGPGSSSGHQGLSSEQHHDNEMLVPTPDDDLPF